jgi:serine/threonine-protein kinase RsbW
MATRRFPANFKSLAPISDFVVEFAERADFSPTDIYSIQTAVDEACSNIIDHAYGGEGIGEIEVNIKQIQNGIQIVLRDEGEPFDPSDVPDPDITSPLEIRKERGLGVFFMRKLMDKVIFEFSNRKGNTLTLIKYRGG